MNISLTLHPQDFRMVRCATEPGVADGKSQFRSDDLSIYTYLDADDLLDIADHFQRLANDLRDEEAAKSLPRFFEELEADHAATQAPDEGADQ